MLILELSGRSRNRYGIIIIVYFSAFDSLKGLVILKFVISLNFADTRRLIFNIKVHNFIMQLIITFHIGLSDRFPKHR